MKRVRADTSCTTSGGAPAPTEAHRTPPEPAAPHLRLVGGRGRLAQGDVTPALLEEARRRLLEEAAQDGTGADLARLDRRLAELDKQVSKAARAVLLEDDESLVSVYRLEAKRLQAERDEVARQRDQAARQQEQQADPSAVIDRALALLARLEELASKSTPNEVRAFLRDHVEKVELWWNHEKRNTTDRHRRGETIATFARGVVWLKPASPFATCLSSSGT